MIPLKMHHFTEMMGLTDGAVALRKEDFLQVLPGSESIPCVMNTVRDIFGRPQGGNSRIERIISLKHSSERRNRDAAKTGIVLLIEVLEAILTDTPLVENLSNKEYLEIILNGYSSLAERFSKIDVDLVHRIMLEVQHKKTRVAPPIKMLIKHSDLAEKKSTLFATVAK